MSYSWPHVLDSSNFDTIAEIAGYIVKFKLNELSGTKAYPLPQPPHPRPPFLAQSATTCLSSAQVLSPPSCPLPPPPPPYLPPYPSRLGSAKCCQRRNTHINNAQVDTCLKITPYELRRVCVFFARTMPSGMSSRTYHVVVGMLHFCASQKHVLALCQAAMDIQFCIEEICRQTGKNARFVELPPRDVKYAVVMP